MLTFLCELGPGLYIGVCVGLILTLAVGSSVKTAEREADAVPAGKVNRMAEVMGADLEAYANN
jgi:hypothetical protein